MDNDPSRSFLLRIPYPWDERFSRGSVARSRLGRRGITGVSGDGDRWRFTRTNGHAKLTTEGASTTTFSTLLFDLDGTILDTTELILASFRHAFATIGATVDDDVVRAYFGRPLTDEFRLIRPDLNEQQIQMLVTAYLEHNHREHDRLVAAVPGAVSVLRSLSEGGYRLGVVTSKRQRMALKGLQLVGLLPLFKVVVHADSTARNKPDPEPVQHALRLLDAKAEETLLLGDSPYDIRSAKAAGCFAVGLVYNTFTGEVLKAAGADAVIEHWPDLLPIVKHPPNVAGD